MKILVYPHDLSIGGSQINAVDLAAAMRDLGHESFVYGKPGPLTDYIARKGLPFVAAAPSKIRPAPARVWQLACVARRLGVDLIHAYEWPPCLDAYYGAHIVDAVPLVCTVLSMSLTPLVPDSVPLILGTRQLQEEAIELRRGHLAGPIGLIEPPIDTEADHPGIDGSAFARDLGLDGADINIVVVSRLSLDLKLDGLERVIDAVGQLAHRFPVRLVIVGDGEARSPLSRRAEAVNSRLGRGAIILAGPLLDPRPAYAVADIVVGMGSSILRGMAFGKPTVVQGESGFSEVLSPDTKELFLWQGFWGHGNGLPGCDLLRDQLEGLLADGDLRHDLGSYGRRLVEERFSLRSAAARLEHFYEQAAGTRPRRRLHIREAARVGANAARTELRYHLPGNRARERAEAARVAAAGHTDGRLSTGGAGK